MQPSSDARHRARSRAAPWLGGDGVQQTLFIVPTCVFLLCLTIFPFFYSVYLSLHRVRLTTLHRSLFVGLANYAAVLKDGLFLRAAGNTALLTVCAIALEVVVGFTAAKIFHEIAARRLGRALRSLYITPMMLTPLAIGVIFTYLLNPTIGVVNYLIQAVGLPVVPWFGTPFTAMASIVLITVWQWAPFMMLLSLAGLTSISSEVYEAARVDGARWHQILRSIELPSIRSILILGMILRVIDMLRFFDIIFVTTRGGPGDSTMVMTLYAYQQDFQYFDIGQGSAAAVLILAISIVVTTFAVRFLRTVEHD